MRSLLFSWHLLLWNGAFWAIVVAQNVTVQPTDQSMQYLPADAWSFSSRLGAINGSFAHAVAENATVIFNITVPATAFFWRGYLPPTPARYSICIDCVSEDVGKVATLDVTAANPSSGPVILFTSDPLDNTTHSITLRNIPNSIDGVVGEMSIDAFIFTAGIPTIAAPSSSGGSPHDKKLIIAILVIAALIGVIIGSLVIARRFGRYSQNRLLLLGSGGWKRWKRKGDVESGSMIRSEGRNRPSIVGNIRVSIGKTADKGNVNTSLQDAVVPYITITSPTTIPASASTYSTHDVSLPAIPISDSGGRDSISRQSDPFFDYAAAYAAFSGIEEPHSIMRSNSALRESATLPPFSSQGREDSESQAPKNDSFNHLPSSFNGRGIRSCTNMARTLSDKIKRGTLPPSPIGERATIGSEKTEIQEADGSPGSGMPASKEDIQVLASEAPIALGQPSFLPSISSKSSPSSTLAKMDQSESPRQPSDLPLSITMSPGRSSPQMTTFDDESEFWHSDGDLPFGAAFVESSIVLPLGSDQSTKEPSPFNLDTLVLEAVASQPDNQAVSEGGENNSSSRNGANTISMITNKTFNTTRSSTLFTPSISEFPHPPFKGINSYSNANEGDTAMNDSNTNINPSSSIPNTIRIISSSGTSESGSSVKSVHGASRPYRQRRPRVAPVKIARLGLGVPVSAQTTPQRRTPGGVRNGLRRSSSRSKASGIARVQYKGEALRPAQQRSRDTEVEEVEDSRLSLSTSESGDVPKGTVSFYMATPTSEGHQRNSDAESKGSSASRLTFESALTTTDEEYANGVQVAVATRGIPPDLPRAIKQSPSPITINPTVTPASDGIVGKNSDDSKRGMIQSRPGPPPSLTPISIVREDEIYRPSGPIANVPVTAIPEGFDGRSVDLHTSQGWNPGSGMPWSPNFLWPSSPPLNFTRPLPSTFQPDSPSQTYVALPEAGERTSQEPASKTYYPTLVTDLSGVSASKVGVESKYGRELGWKDGFAATNSIQTRSRSNSSRNFMSRLSTYSTASTFFGGGQETSSEPPLPFSLDTPLATTPFTPLTPDTVEQSTYFNTRGWQSQSASSQSPVSPHPYSSRYTASTPLSINSVFSTSGSSIGRPSSRLRKPLAQDGRPSIPTPRRGRNHSHPSPVSILPSPT